MRTMSTCTAERTLGATRHIVGLLSVVILGAVATSSATAQTNDLGAALLPEWRGVEQRITRLADAIPAEVYGWRPAEGVRSVSEAIMHIAHGNFLFAEALGSARPGHLPEDLETITVKAEVMAVLRFSFEQLGNAIGDALEGDLDARVETFGTARRVLLRALAHANEHLGQLVAYARSNGVVPPWSR